MSTQSTYSMLYIISRTSDHSVDLLKMLLFSAVWFVEVSPVQLLLRFLEDAKGLTLVT